MAISKVQTWLYLFMTVNFVCPAFGQKNHIIIELNQAGYRQQVVKPTDQITFLQDGDDKAYVPVTFMENGGLGPCTASPVKGICLIAPNTQRPKAYAYAYCSDFKPMVQNACKAPGVERTPFYVRVRQNGTSEGDVETGNVLLGLTTDGEVNHFVDPNKPDVVHWRDAATRKARIILFEDESPCFSPVLAHSECTIQAEDPAYITSFDYLVCSDDALTCDDPTLHVLGSNSSFMKKHRRHHRTARRTNSS